MSDNGHATFDRDGAAPRGEGLGLNGHAKFAGHSIATSYVEQVVDLLTFKPEKRFGDAVKGLHVYGAKVVRPTNLACLIASKS